MEMLKTCKKQILNPNCLRVEMATYHTVLSFFLGEFHFLILNVGISNNCPVFTLSSDNATSNH